MRAYGVSKRDHGLVYLHGGPKFADGPKFNRHERAPKKRARREARRELGT